MTNQPAQREILFRVIRNGKIVGYERLDETQWKWRHANSDRWIDGFYGNVPDLIRDQFAGIGDRNCEKVYEHDIDEHGDEVTFERGCFWLGRIPLSMVNCDRLEITGNIHDKNEREGEK